MNTTWKTGIWQQFGAALDMLENAMCACPDTLWNDRAKHPEFWYLVYHTLFWLDLYLSDSPDEFIPPSPFSLEELDPAGLLPERPYTKGELESYLRQGRAKCKAAIEALTDEAARQRYVFGSVNLSVGELFLYNIRHVQHHVAQLQLILRQTTGSSPPWVIKTKTSPGSA
jgi:hypothetical protein